MVATIHIYSLIYEVVMFKVIAIRQFGIELELRTHEAVEAYLQGGESNRGPDGVRLKICSAKSNTKRIDLISVPMTLSLISLKSKKPNEDTKIVFETYIKPVSATTNREFELLAKREWLAERLRFFSEMQREGRRFDPDRKFIHLDRHLQSLQCVDDGGGESSLYRFIAHFANFNAKKMSFELEGIHTFKVLALLKQYCSDRAQDLKDPLRVFYSRLNAVFLHEGELNREGFSVCPIESKSHAMMLLISNEDDEYHVRVMNVGAGKGDERLFQWSHKEGQVQPKVFVMNYREINTFFCRHLEIEKCTLNTLRTQQVLDWIGEEFSEREKRSYLSEMRHPVQRYGYCAVESPLAAIREMVYLKCKNTQIAVAEVEKIRQDIVAQILQRIQLRMQRLGA